MIWLRRSLLAATALSALATAANAAILTPTDVDAICRVVNAEAASEPLEGRVAVAAVIMTRMGEDRSAAEVVNAPRQFEPVMRAGGDYRNLPLTETQRAVCNTIIELAGAGMLVDPTSGATHFQNRTIVADRAAKGRVSAKLVDFGGMPKTAEIGQHTFYKDAARAPRKVVDGVSRSELRSMAITAGELHEEKAETVFVFSEMDQ
jgi:spore germination cell wall hydrolase CwlJ-like protein